MTIIRRYKNSLILRCKKVLIVFECIFSNDIEKRDIAKKLLRTKSIPVYPYDFPEKYNAKAIEIQWDTDGYPYVIHNGKQLYLKKEWSETKCQEYYNSLIVEQDIQSTHKYLNHFNRYPCEEDVVADIGAAEGIFGLEVVDKAKKVYLFETDDDWIVPLNKTFKEWKNKVVIIEKYVSDSNIDNCISLDEFFKDKEISFIKADIEGAEENMLKGAEQILETKIKKALICTYHRPRDEEELKKIMEKHDYRISFNSGYMLYKWDIDTFKYPYLRRGVMFAYK